MRFFIIDAFGKNYLQIELEIIEALKKTSKDVVFYTEFDTEENKIGESCRVLGIEYVGPYWGFKIKNAKIETLFRIKDYLNVSYDIDGFIIKASASRIKTLKDEKSEDVNTWYVEVLPA